MPRTRGFRRACSRVSRVSPSALLPTLIRRIPDTDNPREKRVNLPSSFSSSSSLLTSYFVKRYSHKTREK